MARQTRQTQSKNVTVAREGISLNDVIEVTASKAAKRPPAGRAQAKSASGPVVGTLAGFTDSGQPLVGIGGGRPQAARATVELRAQDVGTEVVLVYEGDDARKPIILGVLRPPAAQAPERPPQATLDGETVLLTADKEIVLRCGKASITLTRAGKVLIRGEYLLSRSAGVNSIKGGAVEIN